jgi:hypothetical protein
MGRPDIPVLSKAVFGIAVMINLYAAMRVVARFDRGIAAVADEAFAPHRALLAPADSAFALWTLIYIGVFGHAVRVWLPDAQAHVMRARVIIPAIAAAVLNTMWLMLAQRGHVVGTAVVTAMLLGAVWMALEGIRVLPAHDASALLLIHGTYGFYLGWLLIALAANIDVALTGVTGEITGPLWTAVSATLLVGATAAAIAAVRRFRGYVGIPLAFCWGLAWVIRARSVGEPQSPTIAWLATAGAALVTTAFLVFAGSLKGLVRSIRSTMSA